MKPAIPLLLFLFGCVSAQAQAQAQAQTQAQASEQTQTQTQDPVWKIRMKELDVSARRALTAVGTRRTALDSTATRDDIARSMADVLMQNTGIFVKSYGRATLSTVSFRGTAPSHTQVMWNDMKLNSPMLGMVDFSSIPSYFIDDVSVYHGASSVGVTGGGLGGAISLASRPESTEGVNMRYIQGIGSFDTYDQFLRLSYGGRNFSAAVRAFYTFSDNDFTYTNYRKKTYIHDDDGEIVGFRYPVERNKNGEFRDFHIQQELYRTTSHGDNLSLSTWYMDSRRGVPMLNVDHREDNRSKNRRNEKTVRTVAGWERSRNDYKAFIRGGYTYTDLQYLYLGDTGQERLIEMIHSRSYAATAFGKAGADYYAGRRLLFTASAALHQHFVRSVDRAIVSNDGREVNIGYDQARTELSLFGSVRWRPAERLGVSANVRGEMAGHRWAPLIPAVFAEYVIWKKFNVVAKTSATRNYRHPTLNDLYFMPGGNPYLKPERGFTCDGSVEFGVEKGGFRIGGEAAVYDSHIYDWILWLPTFKGFWSPVNVRKVHSSGVELRGKFHAGLGGEWRLSLTTNYTISNAINHGDPASWGDGSVGKQLVYIPKHSHSFTGRLSWGAWAFAYKYVYYSRRFTTSSNETRGSVGAFYMSDVSLERSFSFRWGGANLKLAVNNLFGEAYESVLSHPMAGRNFGLFIEITPRRLLK